MIALIEKPVIPLFDRSPHHSSVPTTFVPAVARSCGPGQPQGRRKRALPWTAASTMAGFRLLGVATCISAFVTTVLPYEALADAELTVPVAHSTSASRVEAFAAFIAEASRRFAIPERWIRAVMQLESSTNERAVSPKGALGLMQVMPKTWVELSVRYGLGIDPFDPRDNILVGTAYLRELHDRFGSPGFLAAYNAGPERFEQHLATGRPLPAETRVYVAALAPMLDAEPRDAGSSVASPITPWRQAPLFVGRRNSLSVDHPSTSSLFPKPLSDMFSGASPHALARHAEGMLARRAKQVRSDD